MPPVPELPLDALHVEGDPVKIQALVQPSSDLCGIHNEKNSFAMRFDLSIHQADVAQGQWQLEVEEISEVVLRDKILL